MISHKAFHESLIDQLIADIYATPPFNGDTPTELQALFLSRCERLQNPEPSDDPQEIGQWLLCRIIGHYPHLTAKIPRDLLWYFGGDCMHYLSDEEICAFQQLDEHYFEHSKSAQIDFAQLRKTLIGENVFLPNLTAKLH